MALGFATQRRRPFDPKTLEQLSNLIIEVLLPCFLFFTTATTSPEFLSKAPVLIVMGILITICNYYLALIAGKPLNVASQDVPVFGFTNILPNTTFFGIPVCAALFGTLGAVYAVLYDFGVSLTILTFGVWKLRGGRFNEWRLFLQNPLIWSVVAGLFWSLMGWTFPFWLAAPFEKLGETTLPFALLVCGTQLANFRNAGTNRRHQLVGLGVLRLLGSPLLVAAIFMVFDWHDLAAHVTIIEAAMPVGLTTAIFVKNYGKDAEFTAAATLWTTLASLCTLPLIVALLHLFK